MTSTTSTPVVSTHPSMGAILYFGGTAFRVWAKFAQKIYVVGEFNDWSETANPLASEENGYWSVDVPGAKEGQQYRYLIHSPFLDFINYSLRGVGQVVFLNNPLSGLLIMLALFIQSPWIGLMSLVAVVSSTAGAIAIK